MRNINLLNRNTLVALVAGLLTVGSSLVFRNSSAADENALDLDKLLQKMAEVPDMDENIDLDRLLPDIVPAPCKAGDDCDQIIPQPRYYFDNAYCKLKSPSEVHRFELLCSNATYLNVYIKDAAGPFSDHWRATVQGNNAYESVAVTESGLNFGYGSPARVYNGYYPFSTYLKAAVVCRYVADGLVSPQFTTGWAQFAFVSDASWCILLDHGVHYDEPDAQ